MIKPCIDNRSARTKYNYQKKNAKARDIDWKFTFEQWINVWIESGHWDERGSGKGKYVMARKGDAGPYSVDNVYICLSTQNNSDAHRFNPLGLGHKFGSGRGWTYIKKATNRPYQVVIGSRYVGCFATQEEAEAAYARAAKFELTAKKLGARVSQLHTTRMGGVE
jgi:hypothetical protein